MVVYACPECDAEFSTPQEVREHLRPYRAVERACVAMMKDAKRARVSSAKGRTWANGAEEAVSLVRAKMRSAHRAR
jgi:hypothetical protein